MFNYSYDVSVIILTYFHETYIEKALMSVLEQQMSFSYEILVSDDASKDGTLEIVNNIKKMYPDISIEIHSYKENVGTTQNLYDAFLRAKGKYITLLSGDDYYCNVNKCSMQKFYLDNHEDCFAVAITTESVYTDGKPTGALCPLEGYRGKDFNRQDFANGINYPIHGIMFRNYFFEPDFCKKMHVFVELNKYIEDLTLCLMFFEFGKVHILDEICYRITTRYPSDINQHNYNTIKKRLDMLAEHIVLMDRLRLYFDGKVNLDLREIPWLLSFLNEIITTRKISYLYYLRYTPKRLFFKGFVFYIKKHSECR